MTKKEKREFINNLVGSVKKSILEKLSRIPENWDGHELRQYIADKFAEQTTRVNKRDYQNDVMVNNL